MASRLFQQFQGSLEREVVKIFANIPIGSTGAVGTLDSTKNQGVYSVTRSNTGIYVVNLGQSASKLDKYKRVLQFTGTVLLSTKASVSTVQLSVDNAAGGSITILTLDDAGDNVDPDSGAVLLLEITLKNSSAK